MNRHLRFLPEAREEYDRAVDWYAAKRISLGEDFVAKLRQTLKQIYDRPRMFSKVHGELRKARVRAYPYVVIFQEFANEIAIVAVFHTSRDPSQWQSRTP